MLTEKARFGRVSAWGAALLVMLVAFALVVPDDASAVVASDSPNVNTVDLRNERAEQAVADHAGRGWVRNTVGVVLVLICVFALGMILIGGADARLGTAGSGFLLLFGAAVGLIFVFAGPPTPNDRSVDNLTVSRLAGVKHPDARFRSVTAGGFHACGLTMGGTVECWGRNRYDQADAPHTTIFTAVAAGGAHTCGLRADQTVECWGNNLDGQADPPGGTFTAVAAGGAYTCGLRADQTVECWGAEMLGPLPGPPPGVRFVSVDAGMFHACGIRADGLVDCWGANTDGQVWPGSFLPTHDDFVQVSAGRWHTCAVRHDGEGLCWGRDDDQQTNPPRSSFAQVAAGAFHTCWLDIEGVVECVGNNTDGQADPPGGTFTQVAAGEYSTCGLRPDGSVVCWGRDAPVTTTTRRLSYDSVDTD